MKKQRKKLCNILNAHTYILHQFIVLQKNVFFWIWTGSKFETFCTSHCPLVNYEKYFYGLNYVPAKRKQTHIWILCVSTFSTVHSVNWISMDDGLNEVPFVWEGMNSHRSLFLAGYTFQYCYSSIKFHWK